MTAFTNLSIQTKILASLALMAALCLFIAGFGASQITKLTAVSNGLITNQAESLRLAALANQDAIDMQQHAFEWILASDPGEGQGLERQIADSGALMRGKLATLKPFIDGPDVARFKTIEDGLKRYDAGLAPIKGMIGRNDRRAAETQMDKAATPAYDAIDAAFTDLVEQQRVDLAAGRVELEKTGVTTWWMLIGVAVAGLVALGCVVLIMVRAQIANPIRAITVSMDRLAAGDTTIEVAGAERRDEVGGMSRAVLVFRDAARALDLAQAEKARLDAEQRMVVDTLEGALTTLAAGDVSNDIQVSFPAEYAGVKTNFNAALANLRSLIGGVTESAEGIRTGSHEIAQASEDLARRTEGNAASLEETSAALVQIDTRLKATALSSGQTVARADQAIATVGGGRATAEEAVQAMGRVSDSAKGIDSVIEGLDKIAFQTRVLAMNAAVEAGRAGDAGRGFAVVADLVSALAMRAEEEAKRARDQLTLTQTDIVTAVQAVQKVDGALANISSDVGEVHTLLGTMADDATAQSAAITQISAAISAMDQSTQQNAAMVEETSAAARNLTTEVTSLAEQAAMFRTEDAAPARRAPRPVPAPAPAKKKAAAPYRSPVKALPAMALADGGGEDDWNAF